MQTTPQIYEIYKQKCIDKNINFLSYGLFLSKIKDQNIAKLRYGFIFNDSFDAFNYLFDNNLHFRQLKPKTGIQKRITKSSIAKMLEITRSALNEKLLLAPNYPHIKRLKTLIEKSVRENELSKNDFTEIQKLAKITISKVKKLAFKKLSYEVSQNLI